MAAMRYAWIACVLAACISKPSRPARDIDGNTGDGDAGPTLRWVTLPPGAIGGRISPRLAWDVADDRALAFGGHRDDGAFVDDLWELLPGSSAWTLVDAGPVGSGVHYEAGFAYDPALSAPMVFGGQDPSPPATFKNDLYAYSTNWLMPTSNSPPSPRAAPGLAAGGTNMYLFGGYLNGGSGLNDVYVLPQQGGLWTPKASLPSNTKFRSTGSGVTWDPHDGLFLALTGPDGADADEVRAFDPTGNIWQIMCLQCTSGGRQDASIVYMSESGRTLLIGGTSNGVPVAGTMIMNFTMTKWLPFDPTMPPARENEGVAYDPVHDAVIVFGGRGPDCNSGCGETYVLAVQ
jgi:hypothetical protein